MVDVLSPVDLPREVERRTAAVWQRHSPFRVDEGVLRGVYRLAVHGGANEVTSAWAVDQDERLRGRRRWGALSDPRQDERREQTGDQSGKQPRPTPVQSRDAATPVHTAPVRTNSSAIKVLRKPGVRNAWLHSRAIKDEPSLLLCVHRGTRVAQCPREDSDLACQSALTKPRLSV